MHSFWRSVSFAIIGLVVVLPTVGVVAVTVAHGRQPSLAKFFMCLCGLIIASQMISLWLYAKAERETRCRKCGCILRGIAEPRCPECGERI